MVEQTALDLAFIKSFPKIELHDHLDGGIPCGVLFQWLKEDSHNMVFENESELASYIAHKRSGSLSNYLSVFELTVSVLQTRERLFEAARLTVLDWAQDGVIYGEIRFAPFLHMTHGLSLFQIIEAVLEGLRLGEKESKSIIPGGCKSNLILCAMRNADTSCAVAQACLEYKTDGVVGFDIAGPEAGFSPLLHKEAFMLLQKANFPFTIHAGEAAGLESIQAAIEVGAVRIGHGTRLIEASNNPQLQQRLVSCILEKRICLEICISSNVQTHVIASAVQHPIQTFLNAGLACAICTDNRLVSGRSLSEEFVLAAQVFKWKFMTFQNIVIASARNSFLEESEKKLLVHQIMNRSNHIS